MILLLTWGQTPCLTCTPSSRRQCATTTGCWRTVFRRHSTTRIIWEATTCHSTVNHPVLIRTSRPMFLPTTQVLQRTSTQANLSRIIADQLPSHHIRTLPNLLPNPSTPTTINVLQCRAHLSTNTPNSNSSLSNNPHDRTAGGHLHRQTSIHHSRTILPARLLPLK